MKKILLLGAGLVTPPLIQYLLDHGFQLTVASDVPDHAAALIGGHPNGNSVPVDAGNAEELSALVSQHDLAISLLPAPFHPSVARACIAHKVPMVTTSYVGDEMRELDQAAHDAGIILLNEIGADPGIDHMSAMRVIHDVRSRGGRIVSFKSYCGGLPAPEANTNPWGYKFSWSPRGVCTAGKADACWREDGKDIAVPGVDLFLNHKQVTVEGLGTFEGYPNRDSLKYIGLYGLDYVHTMFRGTFRYEGWCDSLKKIVDLGMLSEEPVTYPGDMDMANWMRTFAGNNGSDDVRANIAKKLQIDVDSEVIHRFEWLGLFSDQPCPITNTKTTPLDVLATRMEQTMTYEPGERDMLILCHYFTAEFDDGATEDITSTLIDYGQPNGDSAMARAVGLPAATAARLILQGSITETGVHIPVLPDIYNPVLGELQKRGISCTERTTPPRK